MVEQRAHELVNTLRNMRKWGFSVVQDVPGKQQPIEAQMQRARVVACELLGLERGAENKAIDVVAEALMDVAAATERLGQFSR